LARGKHSVGLTAMKDNSAVQGLIGRTEGNLRAARAFIYSTAAEAWHELSQTGKLSEKNRAAIRLAATWTIHQATAVVDAAYHMAGATAVFRANKFERRFRDMHAIAQQIQARDNHYEDVGRFMLDSSATIPRGPTN
jgi:alkylation response protein AidB-like acyl-CoA dehydrogenase